MDEQASGVSGELRDWVLEPRPRAVFESSDQDDWRAEFEPMPRLRVIGPGRFERGYLQRISGLAAEVEVARDRERRLMEGLRESNASLEVSQRVEHGCQRRIDRLEERLEERTQALLESERMQKRLVLALGTMQRDNERLRTQLAGGPGPVQIARRAGDSGGGREKKSASGWWRRLIGGP